MPKASDREKREREFVKQEMREGFMLEFVEYTFYSPSCIELDFTMLINALL